MNFHHLPFRIRDRCPSTQSAGHEINMAGRCQAWNIQNKPATLAQRWSNVQRRWSSVGPALTHGIHCVQTPRVALDVLGIRNFASVRGVVPRLKGSTSVHLIMQS